MVLSSPVAGTKNNDLEEALPGAFPVAHNGANQAPGALETVIAQALAEAAQALLKAANALLQGNSAQILEKIQVQTGPLAPLAHLSAGVPDLNLLDAIHKFLVTKAAAGRSDRYLRALKVSLSSFAKDRQKTPLSMISVNDVEKWIYGLKVRPRTMKGYLADVKTMFHFAARRGFCTAAFSDSLGSIELPDSDTRTESPGIHSPEECQAVLESLRKSDPDIMRMLAIRYFAGVRSAEAHRLTEDNLLLDRGVIEIPAQKAKTRSRRLVTICPALSAWLALGGELRPLCPQNVRNKIALSGVIWKPNVTRHSFVTYHYALFEDAKKTAKEAGHSEEMLFQHYRALVTKSTAEAYFAIVPK